MSERKDQEYFSDGLSDELIERLGQTPGLRVIARTSSFYFKGKSEKLETIAQELRVANILEGSVRKDGTRLRVTAQLIRADTSEHLWSETFDRDLHDIFKVQDEITAAVVSALKIHLISAQQPGARELGTRNLEAYNQFLIGKQSYNQGTSEGYHRAVVSLREAISLDPNYAEAYALLALAQFWVADSSYKAEDFKSAVAAAQQAVELDPNRGAGYAARGFVRATYLFDFSGAQSDLGKAVDLNPGDADVLHRSAVLLGILGDLPTAISREQQALALDPLSAEICMRLAFFLAANQQLEQARPLYERSLAIAENSVRARYNLGQLELLENQPERALATFRQNTSRELRLEGQAKAEYSLGHLEASQQTLQQLISESPTTAPWRIAAVYAWRGEKDQAFAWAERAYERRDTAITWIKIDTSFRGLRDDRRYHSLLRKLNLPDN
jgi:TolB-like protein/Flp pilus assembly protein TadD